MTRAGILNVSVTYRGYICCKGITMNYSVGCYSVGHHDGVRRLRRMKRRKGKGEGSGGVYWCICHTLNEVEEEEEEECFIALGIHTSIIHILV